MKLFTTAHAVWLDDGCCDVKYLDIWAGTTRTYQPGQPLDGSWHQDGYELEIGRDESDHLFTLAADLLMRYQFYPPEMMQHISDFGLWDRWPRVGDRIVQRIHIWSLGRWPLLDVIGVTEIQAVVREPRQVGFTYVTVAPHVTEGEWSARLRWLQDGRVVLSITAVSRPRPQEPARNHRWMRHFQQKAHERGLAHFQQLVRRHSAPVSGPQTAS